ncbi:MAG: hypothetical protein JWR54_1198 [Mucilaginibacter sp.]|nr:hypothetical protein [Mucilaginibacter sp.]
MLIISISYCLLLLIVWGIGMVRYKRLTIPFKVLTWSVLIAFLLAILSKIFAIRYRNNAPIIQLECITGYFFYALTYYFLFRNKKIKKSILISIVIITIFFVINATLLQPFNKVFPSNVFIPAHALYVILSLLLFKEMLQYPLKINIINQSVFWYNTAILFFSTTMFFNFGVANYFSEHNLFDYIIYYFWYFIIYVFHILIGVSLLTYNKEITTTNA